jgi:hypothetical protein
MLRERTIGIRKAPVFVVTVPSVAKESFESQIRRSFAVSLTKKVEL